MKNQHYIPREQRLKRTRTFWIAVPLGVLLCVVLLLTYRAAERKRLQTDDTSERTRMTVPVRVIELAVSDIPNVIPHAGVIRAWQQARILSEVAGQVTSIHAKTGDRLEAGTQILKIDDELLSYAVDQAEANFLQLEAIYQTSKRELARQRSLFGDKVISSFELDMAVTKEKADRARLQAARAQLNIARRDLRETSITSPSDGVLAERFVDIGTTVARGQPVATVVSMEKIKINVGISEKDIGSVEVGMPVTIVTDAYPDMLFSGTVYSVGTKADDMTLSFPIEIVADNNQEARLKPGMVARVRIQTGTFQHVIALPQDAVIKHNARQFVWIAHEDQARRVTIKPIAIVGSQVIVRDCLEPGQLLVVTGQGSLYEGCTLQIISDPHAEQSQ